MARASRKKLKRFINLYPPLLGAGIKVTRFSEDLREIDVEMKLRFWNRNYVGTHYGGSLYSMTDPFYMLMLIENLGPDYVVWDKAANIRFRRPGRTTVTAKFRITGEELEGIRRALETQEKFEPVFMVEVKDESGEVVAEVSKTLHVKRKARDVQRSPDRECD
jgi:acyl-coenzyme A thioesterase PaaI-like protein